VSSFGATAALRPCPSGQVSRSRVQLAKAPGSVAYWDCLGESLGRRALFGVRADDGLGVIFCAFSRDSSPNRASDSAPATSNSWERPPQCRAKNSGWLAPTPSGRVAW
jgi:hypothetical protein